MASTGTSKTRSPKTIQGKVRTMTDPAQQKTMQEYEKRHVDMLYHIRAAGTRRSRSADSAVPRSSMTTPSRC